VESLSFRATWVGSDPARSGKRKLPMREAYVQVDPEIIELASTLESLGLMKEQLIDLGILIGTDFNPDGFKGIGPKTALKLLRENGTIEGIAQKNPDFKRPPNLNRIRQIFLKPELNSHYTLQCSDSRTS